MLRPEDVRQIRFTSTTDREGYDQDEVDQFLERVERHLQSPDSVRLTPEQVVDQRFAVTRSRDGYDQDQVDDFLEVVARQLRADSRAAAVAAAAPHHGGVGEPGALLRPDDVRRQVFRRVTHGYDIREVDDFLVTVERRLRGLEATTDQQVTAESVTAQRFRATTAGQGYDEDEVDDFMDRIVDTLRSERG